ncbi:MAG: FAD-dependent oxidoreductase [Coriobacteriales bacterium]|jgi:fumarate reductase flavoprotein subunit|nr:FAD-dependent oxidoreductase [Coriobacteriales bacterium]
MDERTKDRRIQNAKANDERTNGERIRDVTSRDERMKDAPLRDERIQRGTKVEHEREETETGGNISRRGFLAGLAATAGVAATAGLAACAPSASVEEAAASGSAAPTEEQVVASPVIPPADETLETDVLVCGSGMAGMSAALQAAYEGVQVTIIEKMGELGGGTNFAEGIFACGSPLQKERGIDADVRSILQTEYDFQHYIVDTKLWDVIANNSATDIAWLMEQGVEFIDLFNTGGGAYTHHIYTDYRGKNAILAMEAKAAELGITVLKNTAAEHLLVENGAVIGVSANSEGSILHIKAQAVILATGSAGANFELMKRYSVRTPDKVMYTGAPGIEGDGIRMASEAGMGECFRLMMPAIGLTVEPLGFNSQLAAAGAMEPTNLWFNQRGERFADEGLSLTYIFPNNCVESQVRSYSIFDQDSFDRLVNEGCIMGWAMYIFAGTKLTEMPGELERELAANNPHIVRADTIEEIAEFFEVDAASLLGTVEEYNGFVDAGDDGQYHKNPDFLVPVRTPPFYGFRIKQNCLNMYGGIHVNPKNEVINEEGVVIEGLYAAGSECGGYQGETYGMALPGSCQGVSLGTGRVAGSNAAARALG